MNVSSLSDVLDSWDLSVTVTLDVTRTDEAGTRERELRWRELRRRLESEGAAPADLAVLDRVLAEPMGGGGAQTRFVAVRAGQVALDELFYEGSRAGAGSGAVGPIVDVIPLLSYRARHAPVVVVHADREGADIEVVTAADGPVEASASIHGSTEYVHKVKIGGWRHSHYQRVSENVWRGNAEDAADEALRLFQEHSGKLVLLSGDVRARQLVAAALPQRIPVQQVEGDTRAEGASTATVGVTLVRSLDEQAARAEDEAVRRWLAVHNDENTRDRSTQDLPSTVTAIRQGQVEELLIVPAALRSRPLEIGPSGTDLALPGSPRSWDGESRRAPADLALLRAAVATGAEVQLVELESAVLSDGVAARLRWSSDPVPDPTNPTQPRS